MCRVPKDKLDDIDCSYPARTKANMLEALDLALNSGIYPGWERDRAAGLSKTESHSVNPLPILNPRNNKIAVSRRDQAASAIGRHFALCFYDSLPGLDLHDKVCVVHVQCMYEPSSA